MLRVTLTRGLMRHVLRSQLIAPRISGLHAVRTFARRPSNFDEENAALEPKDDEDDQEEVSKPKGRDPRPSVTQLRIAEMVRRILQRAVLTGQFDPTVLDLRDVAFDIEDVHMSKDLGRATVFWNAMDLDTKMEAIEETIQRSVRILTHVVGASMQLRRIPLLIFRHAGMVTEEEEKRLRGRAGNRPGDVLRMYRLFTALKHDPDRVRAEEFLRSTLTPEAIKDGLQQQFNVESGRLENDQNVDEGNDQLDDDEMGGEQPEEWDDAVEDEHGLVPGPSSESLEDVWRTEENAEAAGVQTQGVTGVPILSTSAAGDHDRRMSQTDVKKEMTARAREREKEDRMVAILKESVRRNMQQEKADGADDEIADPNDDVTRGLEAEVAAAIAAEEALAEQQATLLREKGAGVGRFADQWSRRDKRDLTVQHRDREVEYREKNMSESRLLKRVLAELHEEEAALVADADARAEAWAKRAQRELLRENIISEQQVSTYALVDDDEELESPDQQMQQHMQQQAEELDRARLQHMLREEEQARAGVNPKKAAREIVHDESNVDEAMRSKFMSIMRAQYIASTPVAGRPDIPITGPALSRRTDNQGLTQAEQMLTQLQKNGGNADESSMSSSSTQSTDAPKQLTKLQIRNLLRQSEYEDEQDAVAFGGDAESNEGRKPMGFGSSGGVNAEADLDDESAVELDVDSRLSGLAKAAAGRDMEFASPITRAFVQQTMNDFDRVMMPEKVAAQAAAAAAAKAQAEAAAQQQQQQKIMAQELAAANSSPSSSHPLASKKPKLVIPSRLAAVSWRRPNQAAGKTSSRPL